MVSTCILITTLHLFILLMYLYNHKTYLTGTTLSNGVGLPEPVRRKLAKKGDVVNYRRGPILACAFEDKKYVIILSTHVQGEQVNTHQSETENVLLLGVFISTTSAWVVSTCQT